MKRILIMLLMLLCARMVTQAQTQVKMSDFPRLVVTDSGTYVVVIEFSGGVATNRLYKANGILFKKDSTYYVTISALSAAEAQNVKITDSGVAYTTVAGVNGKLLGYVKVADSGSKYMTPAEVAAAVAAGQPGKLDTGAVSGSAGSLAVFAGAHTLGNSNIKDSGNVVSIYDTVRLKNVPAATNPADGILVRGATQGTLRVVAPPVGVWPVTMRWPGDTILIDTAGLVTLYKLLTNTGVDSVLARSNTAVGKRLVMLSRTQSGSYIWETIIDTNIVSTGYYQSGTFMNRAGLYSLGGSNTGYGVLELDTLTNYKSRVHPPRAQTGNVDLYMPNLSGTMARAEDSTAFMETVSATAAAVSGMVKNGGNSFGAVMSVGTNDSNSIAVKANSKNWSTMNAKGRWVFNSLSTNADTAAGTTAAVKITDTVSQTGTSTHAGITYYMTNTGTLTPNLLTLYYNNTQMLAVGSNGGINAFGGWNSTGGIATSSTLSGAALSVSRNSSTAGVAAIINQQQAGTGSPLKVEQGGNPTDTFGNAGDNHQLGTATNTYKGRAVFAGDVDDLSSAVQGTGPVAGTVFKATASAVTVPGSTSGSANFWMPEAGTLKVVVITLASLNGTASWSFPTVFTTTPVVLNSDAAVTSVTTTGVTVNGSTTSRTILLLGN